MRVVSPVWLAAHTIEWCMTDVSFPVYQLLLQCVRILSDFKDAAQHLDFSANGAEKIIVLMIYHVLYPLTNTHNMHQYLTEHISFTAEQI